MLLLYYIIIGINISARMECVVRNVVEPLHEIIIGKLTFLEQKINTLDQKITILDKKINDLDMRTSTSKK